MSPSRNSPQKSTALRHRINAAQAAVESQRAFFERNFATVASEWKADESRVTFADFAISERIFAALRRDFPDDHYCSEESSPADERLLLAEPYTWILDPVDGTNNYALGLPECGISLGLLSAGRPVYGVIYDFAGRRVVHGGPGSGVFSGQRRQSLPGPETISGLMGFQFPVPENYLPGCLRMMERYRPRILGSSAVVALHVGLGVLDGVIDFRAKVWDMAAAAAIIAGAGREVHFVAESPFPLRSFHPDDLAVPFYAGSSTFCREVGECLAGCA